MAHTNDIVIKKQDQEQKTIFNLEHHDMCKIHMQKNIYRTREPQFKLNYYVANKRHVRKASKRLLANAQDILQLFQTTLV